MVKTFADLYQEVRSELLETEGPEQAARIARELVCAATGQTKADLLAGREAVLDSHAVHRLRDYVIRAREGEPLAYIIGEWDFCGMTLSVTRDVLIPRDDTMAVTELAMKKAMFLEQNPRVLDLCAGSGCIGLAVAHKVKDARVTLGELSPEAIRVAKKNIADQKLSGRVSCIQVDVRQPAAKFLGTFDLIVSNPPYVTTEEYEKLDPSVRDYEPRMALDGGADGLDFYRAIVRNFTAALKPGGFLCFEFGLGQQEAVCEILEQGGYEVCQLRDDNQGITRAVIAQHTGR